MFKAFLSHSSAQKDYVRKVAETLGVDNCYFDERTFENGMKTIEQIILSIEKSSIFVFFISKEALMSDWVKYELSNVRDYIDSGDVIFLPLIIDESITHENTQIKPWIKKEYNLHLYKNPILAARRIKEEIRLMSWREYPDIKKKERLFEGRDEEFALLKKKYYDGNMSSRRCIIVSGFPTGVGRRKFLAEYLKREIATTKEASYEPIVIELKNNHSIEDLIFQLNDIVLYYRNEDILLLNSESKERKVDVAVELIQKLDQLKEYVIIRDDGACVLSNGTLSEWFIRILRHEGLPHRICLLLASSHYVNSRVEMAFQSILTVKIGPLKKDAAKILFYAYTKLSGIQVDVNTEKILYRIPGLPSLIMRCADLLKISRTLTDLNNNIAEIIENEEKSYIPVFNEIKKDEDCYQLLILLSLFEFVSYDIIEKILQECQKEKELYRILERLYSYALYDTVGGNNQYIRINIVVADYIRRNNIKFNPKYKRAFEKVLKENISKSEFTYDLSEYLVGIQNAIKQNIKNIDKKYLIPSFTLKIIIEEYQKKNYNNVIILSRRFLNDSISSFDEIVRSIRYWLCMALCRLCDESFYKEVEYFRGYSKSFLLGFFFRCKKEYPIALRYYVEALKNAEDVKDADYVAKAKHEIVVVKLILKDFIGAHDIAKDNYHKQKTNKYHIEAYFICNVRLPNPDKLLLKKLLEEYRTLIVDSKSQIIYETLKLEYDYYIEHKNGILGEFRKLVINADKSIRYYPFNALKDIAKRMDAYKTIEDFYETYKEELEEKDDELE